MTSASALRMTAISKSFPGIRALSDVDLDVDAGEVHAIVGENGAGKSTLMKILAGVHQPDSGTIELTGETVQLANPIEARRRGIGMVYQELSTAQPISIGENLLVGRLTVSAFGLVNRKALAEEARSCLKQVGLEHLDLEARIKEISQHETQLVELAEVLGRKPNILVMDEPTSALSHSEFERLSEIIHKLRAQGMSIIYISHHLPEIFTIADRVTVMRDGKKSARTILPMSPGSHWCG